MIDERLQRQLAFMAEIDKAKQIVRRTLLSDGSRFETDAEHSWHMAIFAAWMSEYAAVESGKAFDVGKAVRMCLIHDIVEIDAGDAYAYDPAAQVGQAEREQRAAERIFGLLPAEQAQELRALWEEFEARQTPEARYAAALDRVQGVLINYWSEGLSWRQHGVKASQVMKRIEPVREGTPRLWEHLCEIVKESAEKGWLA